MCGVFHLCAMSGPDGTAAMAVCCVPIFAIDCVVSAIFSHTRMQCTCRTTCASNRMAASFLPDSLRTADDQYSREFSFMHFCMDMHSICRFVINENKIRRGKKQIKRKRETVRVRLDNALQQWQEPKNKMFLYFHFNIID